MGVTVDGKSPVAEDLKTVTSDYTTQGETTIVADQLPSGFRFDLESYTGRNFDVDDYAVSLPSPVAAAFDETGKEITLVEGSLDIGSVRFATYSTEFAYDVTNTVYSGKTKEIDFSGTYDLAADIYWIDNGNKLLVLENTTTRVYTFSCSTAYDVSTMPDSDDQAFMVGNQTTNPQGLAFNNDGSKMFIAGGANNNNGSDNTVYSYDLSTEYDISTATYTGNSYSTGEDITGIGFNSDGTQMYISNKAINSVIQHNLSTGFDLTTASQSGISRFLVTHIDDPNLNGIEFSPNGTKLLAIESRTNTINEYETYSGVGKVVLSSAGARDTAQKVRIKDGNSGAGTQSEIGLNIETEGSETIDGENKVRIESDYGGLALQSDGSNWRFISGYKEGVDESVIEPNVTTVSSDYTTSGEDTIFVKTGQISNNVMLSTDDANKGNRVRIVDKSGNASSNNININTESNQKVNGQNTAVIDSDYESVTLESDGDDWFIVSRMSGGKIE